ncbi:MAG: AI-2E family transporter [Dehalococcoidia bacterium]|nr:AI-2E family transporter [Dehalococcoidia bacterium]
MEKNPWLRALLVLLVIIAGFYLLTILWQVGREVGDIILMFFLAWLLAFILTPLARFLTQYNRQKKILAVVEIYAGLILLLLLLGMLAIPAIAAQLYQLGASLPGHITSLPTAVTAFQSWFGDRGIVVDLSSLLQSQSLVQGANSLGAVLAQNALGIAQFLASAVTGLFIILVLSFYMMMDGERIARDIVKLLPARFKEEAGVFIDSIDRTFGGYIRGVLIQAVVYGIGTAIVMRIAGLGFIEVVSIFAGAMMVIPIFGGLLAIIPPFFIAVFGGSLLTIVFVLVALLILQQVVLNVVAPKVMSENVGIHPLLVFLAILLGLKVAGVWGAIFGVPVAGVVNGMAQFFINRGQATKAPIPAAVTPPLKTGRHK